MAVAETIQPANNAAAAKKTGGRGRRSRKNEGKDGEFIYCLDGGTAEGGKIVLSKPDAEDDILRAAYKNDAFYYRIQKFKADVAKTPKGLMLVGVPAE